MSDLPLFDIPEVKENIKCLIVGQEKSGKTTLINNLTTKIKNHDRGVGFTKKINELNNLGLYIIPNYNKEVVKSVIDKQGRYIDCKKTASGIQKEMIVFDNCFEKGSKWEKSNEIKWLLYNSRFFRISFILSMESPDNIMSSCFRVNLDYIFILQEDDIEKRKVLYDNYAACSFDNFDCFCNTIDKITLGKCIVIKNFIDKCEKFWYKF